jgi:hypothetical protein
MLCVRVAGALFAAIGFFLPGRTGAAGNQRRAVFTPPH